MILAGAEAEKNIKNATIQIKNVIIFLKWLRL